MRQQDPSVGCGGEDTVLFSNLIGMIMHKDIHLSKLPERKHHCKI